jgi:hypothetical protein
MEELLVNYRERFDRYVGKVVSLKVEAELAIAAFADLVTGEGASDPSQMLLARRGLGLEVDREYFAVEPGLQVFRELYDRGEARGPAENVLLAQPPAIKFARQDTPVP